MLLYLFNLSDTGSVNLAVPDSKCHQYDNPTDDKAVGTCPDSSGYYNINDNTNVMECQSGCSICQDHNCWYSVSYADGSYIRGPLVTDIVQIANLSASTLFGAIERESPQFSTGFVSGIMGMAFHDLNTNVGDSFFDNLLSTGQIDRNIFSMCMGEEAGELYLGGYDPNLDAGPIHYINLVEPYDFYRVPLNSITLGDQILNVDSSVYSKTIVDSGTSLIQLPTDAYNAFVNQYQRNYAALPHVSDAGNIFTGFCFPDLDIELYPSLYFNFNGLTLEIPAEQYFINSVSITGEACRGLGIKESGNSVTGLGDVFMRGFNVIFDREQYRMGFSFLQNCADVAFISGIHSGDQIQVDVGETFQLKVAVQYLITHKPVQGLIVEFFVTRGSAKDSTGGAATDVNGIATFETYVLSNGTTFISAIVPGSLSPVLTFHIDAKGDFITDYYTPYYSEWKNENTSKKNIFNFYKIFIYISVFRFYNGYSYMDYNDGIWNNIISRTFSNNGNTYYGCKTL